MSLERDGGMLCIGIPVGEPRFRSGVARAPSSLCEHNLKSLPACRGGLRSGQRRQQRRLQPEDGGTDACTTGPTMVDQPGGVRRSSWRPGGLHAQRQDKTSDGEAPTCPPPLVWVGWTDSRKPHPSSRWNQEVVTLEMECYYNGRVAAGCAGLRARRNQRVPPTGGKVSDGAR